MKKYNFITTMTLPKKIGSAQSLLSAGLAVIILTLCGCTHLDLADKTTPSIKLKQPETRSITVGMFTPGTITLPSGVYDPDFQTQEGIYYRSQKSLIQRAVGIDEALHGGLFLPKSGASDSRQGFWEDAIASESVATMGTRTTARVHRFDKPIEYEVLPLQQP